MSSHREFLRNAGAVGAASLWPYQQQASTEAEATSRSESRVDSRFSPAAVAVVRETRRCASSLILTVQLTA